MMKTWKFVIYLIPAALLLTSCSGKAARRDRRPRKYRRPERIQKPLRKKTTRPKKKTEEPRTGDPALCRRIPESLSGRDQPKRRKHDYKDDSFVHNGDRLSYQGDSNYTYRLGVDVSEHQGICGLAGAERQRI